MTIRGLGCPVCFAVAAGQCGDAPQVRVLIEGLPAVVVMAGNVYDSDVLRQIIAVKDTVSGIPNNTSRVRKYFFDKHLYGHHYLIECCFSELKQFRTVAARYKKTAVNYLEAGGDAT